MRFAWWSRGPRTNETEPCRKVASYMLKASGWAAQRSTMTHFHSSRVHWRSVRRPLGRRIRMSLRLSTASRTSTVAKAITSRRSRSISGHWQFERKRWARSIRMSQHHSTTSQASPGSKATTPRRSRSISGPWQSERKCWARNIRMSPHLSTIWRTSTSTKGDYAKAEPLYQRALAIREAALGAEHPDLAATLANLANLSWTSKAITQLRSRSISGH